MKTFLLAFAAILALGLTSPAQAGGVLGLKGKTLTVGIDTCIDADTYAAPDGSDNASDGSIQAPTLLDSYGAYIPPCPVAGVDYAVGPHAAFAAAYKDPSNPANLPTATPVGGGWRYVGAGNGLNSYTVRCDSNGGNGDGAVLEGFYFDNVGVSNVACTNVVIRNNKFRFGDHCVQMINQSTGTVPLNMVVEYNELDGGGRDPTTAACTGGRGESMLFNATGGTKIARYNHIHDMFQHAMSSSNGGDVEFKYNLIERCGHFQGNHCNGTQFIGKTHAAPKVWGNVFVSPQPDIDLTTTGTFTAGSNTITLVAIDQVSNTSGQAMSVNQTALTGTAIPGGATLVSGTIGGVSCPTTCTGTIVMSANATASGVFSFTIADVYPSGLVNPIQIAVASTGGPNGSGITSDASVMGNVVIDPGPQLTSPYQLSCLVGSGGGTNSNMRADGNYFDSRGATAAIRPKSTQTCTGDTYGTQRPNIDMVTGASLPSPP